MKKPSVTTLCKMLDKPALFYWANKIGLEGISINDYRKKSTTIGISNHKKIEKFILHNESTGCNNFDKNIKNFLIDKEIIYVEKKIETGIFKGRIDLVYKHKGDIFLCDFKTNQSNVYFENELQLVCYSMAVNCDKFCIVNIPSMEIVEVKIKDISIYVEIVKALHTIHVNKSKL